MKRIPSVIGPEKFVATASNMVILFVYMKAESAYLLAIIHSSLLEFAHTKAHNE